MLMYRRRVRSDSIPFVLIKPVLGVLEGQLSHQTVTRYLCNDACGSD